MKWASLILISSAFFSTAAFSELSSNSYEFQSAKGKFVQLSEQEYRCLQDP